MSGRDEPQALRLAQAPAAGPAARPLAVLLAPALLVPAGCCAHDLLVRAHAVHRPPLLPGSLRWIDRTGMTAWTPWIAGAALLLGLVFTVAALRPRRRTHLAVGDGTPELWIRATDLARLCSAAAAARPGVVRARTAVTPRRVVVTLDAGGRSGAEIEAEVAEAVGAVTARLTHPPRVRVRIPGSGS